MKNIKIILFALTMALFTSCNTDIVQPGELYPDTTFETVADLQQGLVGVYGAIPGENEIQFNSIFTDEVRIGFANGGQGLISGEYTFILNVNSTDAYSIWATNYTLINFANRLIAAGGNMVVPPSQKEEFDDIMAQAHILRAYGHFKLLTYFSTDLTDDNALGCILVDFVPTIYQQLPRNKNGEVFTFINKDLEYVDKLTSNVKVVGENKETIDRNYISPDMVTAMRARMAAYRGKYTEALTYAQTLITKYPLTIRVQYDRIWEDIPIPSKDEVIFKLARVNGDAKVGATWASVDATIEGSPFYEMSTDLINLLYNPNFAYDKQPDVRAKSFIGETSIFSEDNVVIDKYSGSQGFDLLNAIKVFRSSEMYFIKAEAQASVNDFAGVAATLQAISKERFLFNQAPIIPVPLNSQAAWAEILKQRRIELCYEGHRWVDLKRLGVKAGVSINRNEADCAVYNACFLDNTDYRFTMPIPFAETAANVPITAQQNPGY